MQIRFNTLRCFNTTIPQADKNVTHNYDFFLYARAIAGSDFFVDGRTCLLRMRSNIPMMARILFNTNQVEKYLSTNAGFQTFTRMILHEMIHIFGFTSEFLTYWKKDTVTRQQYGRNFMITPEVKKQVESYFGCADLGMLLEDDEEDNQKKLHWQKESFSDEIMIQQFSIVDTLYLSNITLAMLYDTGFYEINFSYSENSYMGFGKNRGCSFLTTNLCSTRPEYCDSGNGITFYNTAKAICSTTIFIDTCKVYIGFINRVCKLSDYPGSYGSLQLTLQTSGWNSRGYMASVISLQHTARDPDFRCYVTTCYQNNTMQVTIGTNNYSCNADSQEITDSNNFNGKFICPADIAAFCAQIMTCEDFCEGKFICVKGRCIEKITCIQGKYLAGTSCIQCHASCATCNSGTFCQTCAENYNPGSFGLCIACSAPSGSYNSNTHTCDCSANYYQQNGQCVSDCSQGNYKHNQQCVSSCPSGYLPNNGICIDCSSSNCCSNGQYYSNDQCNNCDSSCATCNSATACQTCAANYNPGSIGLCITCSSPRGIYNSNTQTCDCSANYFEQNGQCVSDCSQGNYKHNQQCVSSCPSGYLPDNNAVCIDCSSSSCCSNGQFYSNNQCNSCDSSCATCNSATACQTCAANYNPGSFGLCIACSSPRGIYNSNTQTCDCSANYFEQNGQCVSDCSQGNYKHNQQCVSSCPSGYLPDNNAVCIDCSSSSCCSNGQFYSNNQCNNCDSSCATCNSATACQTCAANYNPGSIGLCITCPSPSTTYNSNTQSCDCSANYFSENGQCVSDCSSNMYKNGTSCLSACPSGTLTNAARQCISCSGQSCCTSNQFYDGLTCLACPISCATCQSATSCSSCAPNYHSSSQSSLCIICQQNSSYNFTSFACECAQGYVLQNNACVKNDQCSSRNKYKHKDKCVSNCPDGFKANSEKKCEDCSSTKCSTRSVFVFNRVLVVGKRIYLFFTFVKAQNTILRMEAGYFRIILVLRFGRMLQQTREIQVNSINLMEDSSSGFSLDFKNPHEGEATIDKISVQVNDPDRLASPPLSNSEVVINQAMSEIQQNPNTNIQWAGYVLVVVSLIMSLIYKIYLKGLYNPFLIVQMVFLSLFFKQSYSTLQFYVLKGFRFADLYFGINILGEYTEAAPVSFQIYGNNANLLNQGLISLIVFMLLLVVFMVTIFKKLTASYFILYGLGLPATPLLFTGLSQIYKIHQNSEKKWPLYISVLFFSLVILLNLVAIIIQIYYHHQIKFESEQTDNTDESQNKLVFLRERGQKYAVLIDFIRKILLIGIVTMSYAGRRFSMAPNFILIVETVNVVVSFLTMGVFEMCLGLLDFIVVIFLTMVNRPEVIIGVIAVELCLLSLKTVLRNENKEKMLNQCEIKSSEHLVVSSIQEIK